MRRFFLALLLAGGLTAAELPLSEVPWTDAMLFWTHDGFMPPQFDRNLGGNPIRVGGKEFRRGMAVHTPASIVYHLGGRAERFTARIGIDDEDHPNDVPAAETTAYIVLLADRREIFRRQVRLGQPPEPLDVRLTGVTHLEVRAETGRDYPRQRVVFADPALTVREPEAFLAAARESFAQAEIARQHKADYPPPPAWKSFRIERCEAAGFRNAYRISDGVAEAVLLPEFGGRVYSFGLLNGPNLLQGNLPGKEAGFRQWGLAADFGGGHFVRPLPRNYFLPSDPILKHGEYDIAFPAEGTAVMTSAAMPGLLLRAIRLVRLNKGKLEIENQLVNTAPFPRELGIWSLTRIRPEQLNSILFPESAQTTYFSLPKNNCLDLFGNSMEWLADSPNPAIEAKFRDGGAFRIEYGKEPGTLHFFHDNRFTELEFHTPLRTVAPCEAVTLREIWQVICPGT